MNAPLVPEPSSRDNTLTYSLASKSALSAVGVSSAVVSAAASAEASAVVPASAVSAPVQTEEAPAAPATKTEDLSGNIVKAPLVGTFYMSSGPGKEAFAPVGKKVKKGDVLCIIEAMKIMNEVVSDFDGEVKEILAENEQLVEYGQPLFRIG